VGDWLNPALRFSHYALLLGLFGLTTFRVIGLRSFAMTGVLSNMRLIKAAAVAAPFLSLALMLVSIAAMMDQPVSQLDWATVKAMLVETSLGWAFIARVVLLGVAAVLLGFSPSRVRWWRPAALLYSLAVVTLPWSGHAAATDGTMGLLHRLNDAAHLFAAGLWIGAIGWFLYLVTLAHRAPDRVEASALLSVMHRFAPFGVMLVAVVTITGAVNTALIVGWADRQALLTTSYGWLLIAKLVVVGLMLVCAARNASLNLASTKRGGLADRHSQLVSIRISLVTEIGLAATVIGLVALLGLTSPMP
jgi:copper resistance protein D